MITFQQQALAFKSQQSDHMLDRRHQSKQQCWCMPQDQRDQPLDLSPASMRMPSNSDLSPAALIHDTLDTEM